MTLPKKLLAISFVISFFSGFSQGRLQDSLALVDIYNNTNGSLWTNNANWLSGTIDTWAGVTVLSDRVTEIDLASNNLDGSLSTSIGDFDSLTLLHLNNNALVDSIPIEIANLSKLRFLQLNQNLLTGSFPYELTFLTELESIRLNENFLTGSIPMEIGNLFNLQILVVGNNVLAGSLPTTLGNLTSLTELQLSNNFLNDSIPTELTSISGLQILSIDGNQFSHLPDLTALTSLTTFNISDNYFTFEDIEPNEGIITQNDFQKPFGEIGVIFSNVGDSPTITPLIPNQTGNESYQWEFNGLDLPGETGTSLNLFSITSLDYGEYILKITSSVAVGDTIEVSPVFLIEGQGVPSNITSNTTWTGIVGLNGPTYVEPGATLTIDPGTIVKAVPGTGSFASYLTITRGAFIDAQGTAESPIIFTTVEDGILPGEIMSPNMTISDRGRWGGLILLGNARVSLVGDTIQAPIAGISDPNLGLYGGSDDLDNSGILSYVSIRHAGANIGVGDSLNALTLAGVGSGTSINNIEVAACQEDGIEWFGGTVDVSEVVIWSPGDDALDTDQGWIGTCSNFLVIEPEGGSAMELDGPEGTPLGGFHTINNGSVYVGVDGGTLVDWDVNTSAAVSNVYFYGFDPGYSVVTPVESYNGDGSVLSSNWEYTLSGGLTESGVFTGVDPGILTGVTENANTIGITSSAPFEGTWAYESGILDVIGLPTQFPVVTSDSLALVALYNATNGSSWGNNANWLSGSVDSWFGITTNGDRVTQILLPFNGLSGALPTEIGDLTALEGLYLNGNQLFDIIPSSIGNLTLLKQMDLSENDLTGSLPPEFDSLDSLEFLSLWFNSLNGNIPPEIGGMLSLQHIDLNGNQLDGAIPPELGNLSNLRVLSIPANQLTGSLPTELGNLTNLQNIWFDNNDLTGSLPSEFNNLTNLQTLSIAANSLSGPIPDLTNVTQLVELNLWQNHFDGSIPNFIGDNTGLYQINLFNNNFSGAVPSNFIQLTNLNELNIRENQLVDLPDLSSLTQITFFDVSFNRFELDDLAPNSDVITQNDGQIVPVLAADSLALIDIYNALDGPNWAAEHWLTDTLVAAWQGISVNGGRVTRLDLNSFGAIGDVPAAIGNLDSLEVFGAANNQLTSLPAEIGTLTNLRSLYMDNNTIEGPLPPEIGDLTKLEEIYIQQNRLTGEVPPEFSNLVNLRAFWVSENQMTGLIPDFLATLPELNTINFSNNNFEGAVPAGLSSAVNLSFIYGENNALSGAIPNLSATNVFDNFDISGNRYSMQDLLDVGFDPATPFDKYNDQEFVYTITTTSLAPGNGSVTLTVTNAIESGNEFQWRKNGQDLIGENLSILDITSPTSDDNGIYTCVITNPAFPDISFRSESFVLDVADLEKRYATSVNAFSVEKSSILGAASEILGQPNSVLDFTPFESSRSWIPLNENTNDPEEITVGFDSPAPINTVWIYAAQDSNIDSVLIKNPVSGEFELAVRSNTFANDTQGIGLEEIQYNFPTSTFAVDEVRLVVTGNDQIDAIAIGDNGLEIGVPFNLFANIVTDSIYNIGWSHTNNSDSTTFSLERSIDGGTTFVEIAVIDAGFTAYSDRNVPIQDSVYYRVKAIQGIIESQFSNELLVENCPSDLSGIPTGSWTGTAVEVTPIFGVSGFDDNVQITDNGDGTFAIIDFMARYLADGFGIEGANVGTLSSGCSGLDFTGSLVAGCGNNDIVAHTVEFYPGADSLVIQFTWDCGGDIKLKYTKNAVEPADGPPANVSASVADANSIRLTWQDFSNFEEEWVIERSDGDDTNFVEIASIAPNPQAELQGHPEFEVYYDNTVVAGTTYFYQLRSRNGGGDSDPSDTVSVTAIDPLFTDVTQGDMLTDQPTNSYTGSWGDYDGDGDLDLYVTNWHAFVDDPILATMENYLYENSAGTFSRVSVGGDLTDAEFVSRGANWADFDNDGNMDIFVNGQGSSDFINGDDFSYLFTGDGAGGFTANTDFVTFGTSSTPSDLDNDGNLDIILNAFEFLYKGNGDGTFDPIEDGLSITNGDFFPAFWTALTLDINKDSLPDLFLSGDQVFQLYLNRGGLTFERVYDVQDDDLRTRGSVFGDFDHDGHYEIIVADNQNSLLLETDETGIIAERTDLDFLGEDISAQRGLTVLDFDNDGNEDLLWILDDGVPTLFRGLGDGTFSRVDETEQLFAKTTPFSAISVADYDQDGDVDAFISDTESTRYNSLYENAGSTNNHLRIDLQGTVSNSLGIGAQIRANYGGIWRLKQVTPVNGLWTGNEITAHFGLGTSTTVDSLEVIWPSGQKTLLTDVAANQTIDVLELAAPYVKIDSIVTDQYQPEITGIVSDFSSPVEVILEGNTYNAINNADSTWFLPAGIVDSLFDGQYQIIASAINASGVGIDTAILVIDQKPPIVTVDTLITNNRSPELTGTVNDINAIISVEIDKEIYEATNNLDSTWILEVDRINPPLEDGTYDVIVSGKNQFGISMDSTTNELRLDASAPTLFVDNIGTSITSPELTGFIDDFTATFTVNVEGRGDFTPDVDPADSSWSIAQGVITPGFTELDNPITIVAMAEDSLFNISYDTGQLIISNTIVALEPSRITTNSFRANWSSVTDAVNYQLEIATDSDFSAIQATIDTLSTSFEIEDLDFETEYFYRVTFSNGVDAPITSDTVGLQTLIKPETVEDFNALLAINDATGATTNWALDLRKQDWDHISLVEERVATLDLSNNTLAGNFPLTRALTALTELNISGNNLVDLDSLAKLRSITTLNVEDNLLEFDDLEPLRIVNSLTYSPQKTILQFDEFLDAFSGGAGEKADGDTLKVNVFADTTLTVTSEGRYNSYMWYRNEAPVLANDDFVLTDSTLRIQSIDYDKMGEFRAEVTNDSLPDLTIPVDSMFVFAIAPFSVNVLGSDGELIPETVDGFLLLTEQRGAGFDTLSSAYNQPSSFRIDSVILGDYLVSVDSDREKYIPTYYANAFEWIDADTIEFRSDDTVSLNITVIPPPPNQDDVGVLDVLIEEDFGDDTNGRIEARRRAKGRKCGLRRRVTGGRIAGVQDDHDYELFAYGETDENGEFKFGFLPEGEYRFFVEYPGIPLDQSSFVEFTVGELGLSDTEFSLNAFATEDGVAVSIERVLGVIFEYFKDLKVYPNPSSEVVKIAYRHLKAKNVAARLVDLSGNELWHKDVRSGYDGFEQIDVSDFETGIYLLYIYDKDNRNKNVVTYRIMVR